MKNRLQRLHDAMLLQDACNPSGVAHQLIRFIADLREEAGEKFSTDMIGKDPSVILTVAKLADLCRIDVDWFRGPIHDAHKEYSEWKIAIEKNRVV